MPKTPSVILREKMFENGLELLDIYHRKDGDVIRFKDRMTGRVFIYNSKKHVRDFVDEKDYQELINELLKITRS
jgi:uncharacterized protein YkvS